MAACTGLTLVKEFIYRDGPEQWSNTYHLRNTPPADPASWLQLAKDLATMEGSFMSNAVSYVAAWGYNDDAADAQAVWSHDFTQPGPPPVGAYVPTGSRAPGDAAAVVWWKLDRRNTRGKPVYLRKYFHQPWLAVADADELDASYVAMLRTFATNMDPNTPGALYGGVRSRTGTWGTIEHGANTYVTTRTLKRRGKRPLPG